MACFILCVCALGGTSAKVAKTVDSGAGFFIEENEDEEPVVKKMTHEPGRTASFFRLGCTHILNDAPVNCVMMRMAII